MIYHLAPMPKPRMTRADAWKARPCVTRYWQWKDHVRKLGIKLPDHGVLVKFILPMPSGRTKAWKEKHVNTPHTVKPDLDNLIKALFDAVYESDAHIWEIHAVKYWGHSGSMEITETDKADLGKLDQERCLIVGWDNIGKYLGGMKKQTVIKHHNRYQFPILWLPGGKPAIIPAYFDLWLIHTNEIRESLGIKGQHAGSLVKASNMRKYIRPKTEYNDLSDGLDLERERDPEKHKPRSPSRFYTLQAEKIILEQQAQKKLFDNTGSEKPPE